MKTTNSLLLLVIFCISCQSNQTLSPRFNHVVVQVSNMEQSVEFYTKAFDLKVTNDSLKHVVYTFEDGSQAERDIHIVLLKFPGQDFVFEMSEVAEAPENPGFFHHVGVDVEHIDQAFQRVVDAGAEVVVPIRLVQTQGVEAKQAFLKGPDGEMIELMEIVSGEF